MIRILTLIGIIMCGIGVVTSYAGGAPRGVATDHRVKVVQYDPNNVVILKGHFGYQTQITFATNESIQNVSLGDSLAWQAVPVGNSLFIKPVADSKTNMTVVTSANSYLFQLDSQDQSASPTYKLQFVYSPGGYDQAGAPNAVGTFDPEKVNWKYSYTGDKTLVPIEAFDNGQFTYFKFKNDGGDRLPAVFIVDKNQQETLVNYHMHGKYLVVHSVAKRFTLRSGDYVTCIYSQ